VKGFSLDRPVDSGGSPALRALEDDLTRRDRKSGGKGRESVKSTFHA